ncbi:Sec39 [Kluyveromyces lactis]|nr:Sec39 [Kluyveromyces lactis]
MNPQLYLCASVFTTRGDVKSVSEIYQGLQSDAERLQYLKLLCVMWPELDDPTNISFVLKDIQLIGMDESSVLLSLIQEDSSLTTISEMDVNTISKRVNALASYVEETLIGFNIHIRETHMLEDFLRARTLVVNSLSKDPLCSLELLVNSTSKSLVSWLDGILKPLDHLNRRLDTKLSIFQFENLSAQDAVSEMWKLPVKEVSVVRSMMKYEVEPYLKFQGSYDPFYEVIFNPDNFPLDSINNFQIYKYLSSQPTPLDTKFNETKWNILYSNGKNLASIPLPNLVFELESLIKSFGDDSQIFSGISLDEWLVNLKFMNAMDIKDLKSLKKLQNEDSVVQTSYFSIITQNMFQGHIDIKTVQNVVEFIESSTLFDKLTNELQTSILLESLLKLGKFDILEQFVSTSGIKIQDKVIIQHFWRFFNIASNGSLSDPDMKNANRTLNLLGDKENHSNLYDILTIVDRLSHYSLSFKRGIPFKPAHILEFKANPMEIVEKLLDLNPKLRKNIEVTFDILKELYTALQVTPSDKDFTEEYSKLLSEHINNSLANGDFKFAFDQAINLIERPDAVEHWVTIFQVGKYIDPNWLDAEIPTEIIYLQLGIVSKLLHICPEKEYEVITSQWSGLELELSTRNLISDKYSLENTQKSNDNFMSDVSTNVGNFLSGKFQWNIGGA